jgi:hypothetical protein
MTTDIPKGLILFPAHPLNDAPQSYGVVEISQSRGAAFFEVLRQHAQYAADIARASASPPITHNGKTYVTPLYNHLSSYSGMCSFLHTHPEDRKSFEESFHGVEDIETLLQMTAENVLEPNHRGDNDILAALDDSEGDGKPVLVNLAKWYENCRIGGFFTDSPEAFWVSLQEQMINTEADSIIVELPLQMPIKRHVLDKNGRTIEFEPFEKNIEFYFACAVKHSDIEQMETRRTPILPFVAAFEDAVRSLP